MKDDIADPATSAPGAGHPGPPGAGHRGQPGFVALVAAEQTAMLRLAVLLVGSRAVAEEVVQEALATVHQRWDQLDRPGAYLRSSVVNGCRAVLRRRRLEERHAVTMLGDTGPVELPTGLIELRDALDALTEPQRVVVVLRYLVDLPDDEIAAVLVCRPATVRSHARRALSALRKELR